MTTMNKPSMQVAERELVIERIFDAPVELVWKAWTDPEYIKHWWGPKDFTAPVIKTDFRVGGSYLFLMRSPSGEDYWSTGVYQEIVPLKRIVYTDSFSDENGNVVPASHYGMGEEFPRELQVTLTFEDTGDGKTRFTLRHAGMPEGNDSDMAQMGWNQSLDRLAETIQ